MATEARASGAPENYQEWLECLNDLKQHKTGKERLAEIARGTVSCNEEMRRKLEDRIADTVSEMANYRVRRFVRQVNQLLSFGEVEELPVLFRHFKKEIGECLFFREISFVSKDVRNEIERQIEEQIGGLWNDMIHFLRRQAEEDNSPALEDSLFLIRRIILFKERMEVQ